MDEGLSMVTHGLVTHGLCRVQPGLWRAEGIVRGTAVFEDFVLRCDAAVALCLHCLCLVIPLPLPSWLRHCRCLVSPFPFVAETLPLPCVSTAFRQTVP